MKNLTTRLGGLFVVGLALLLVVGLATPGAAGEKVSKKVKDADRKVGAHADQIKITDGKTHPKALRGTAWLQYDDGTREDWGASFAPNSGAAGNKFVSTWGTFYCDIMSAFAVWTTTGTYLYFSAWTGTTNTGADLVGNTTTYFTGLPADSSGWVAATGTMSPFGWIGDTAVIFNDTAWLGVYVYSSNDVGIDTNGTGSHGFSVDSYSGTGYTERSWNAMVRARFNGDAVPVELMAFTTE